MYTPTLAVPPPLRGADAGSIAHRLPHIAQRVLADNPLTSSMRHQIEHLIAAIPHRTLEAFTDTAAPDMPGWHDYVRLYPGLQLVAGALVLCRDVFLSSAHRDDGLLSHRVRPLCLPEAAGLAHHRGAWSGAGHAGPSATRRRVAPRGLEYRGARIPRAFWKVVAIVTDDGRPSATAYKVSQARELEELEFVFAGYKTFQISIQQVMADTSIDFGVLVEYDGFSQHERATNTPLVERLDSLEGVRI
jgi:hypothetical protein